MNQEKIVQIETEITNENKQVTRSFFQEQASTYRIRKKKLKRKEELPV